jgi:hypothetical protein
MMVANFTVLSRAGFGIILFAPLAWLAGGRDRRDAAAPWRMSARRRRCQRLTAEGAVR